MLTFGLPVALSQRNGASWAGGVAIGAGGPAQFTANRETYVRGQRRTEQCDRE